MDDGSPAGFILLIVFFIFSASYFAATETAMASVNRIRIMTLADNGDKRAKRVLYILDHFDKALTTILVANNIMHIGCASVATLFATKLWGMNAVTLTTVLVTLVLFLFAETLPKRFAKANSESFALFVSWSLLIFMQLLKPVTFLFSKISEFVSRPFKKGEEAPTVTEDELYDIIETVAEEGAIDNEKTELVQNALDFSDTTAADILTPWGRVITVSTTMNESEILSAIRENIHSRLPVVDVHGSVIGMLRIRKYMRAYLEGEANLVKCMDEAHFVAPDIAIDDLLPEMSRMKTQLVIVRDAREAVLGIVSVEDILEELVGEIYDEDDDAVLESAEKDGDAK